MCYAKDNTEEIGGAFEMAKITYVVKELNKPSLFALANLNQVIYQAITEDTYSANNKDISSTITKLSSDNKMEKTA